VPATHDDAILMVELAKWSSMIGLEDAIRELYADEFEPEVAEVMDQAVGKVLMFGETIGTLVKHSLLSRELVYDWLWVEGMWAKVGPAVDRARSNAGVAELYENFETLAAGQTLL
jgi:hypothetical protein